MSDNDENKKPIEVVFMPGCFDDFEGSQEELDEMIQHIKDMAKSGELFEKSTAVMLEDIEDLIDETDPLEIEEIVNQMTSPRIIQ
jgi:hypothetical protein